MIENVKNPSKPKNLGALLMIKKVSNIIHYFEDTPVRLSSLLFSFWFIVTLRHFIELFSDGTSFVWQLYVHYLMGYLAGATCLIFFFHIAIKKSLLKVSKVIFLMFLLLLVAPVVDLFISKGNGFDMRYMLLQLLWCHGFY